MTLATLVQASGRQVAADGVGRMIEVRWMLLEHSIAVFSSSHSLADIKLHGGSERLTGIFVALKFGIEHARRQTTGLSVLAMVPCLLPGL